MLHVNIIAVPYAGPRREKICLWGCVNNEGADQPAHPRSLSSTFVIHILKSIRSKFATSEISVFLLVSVAEETGLSLAMSETPKDKFYHNEAHIIDLINAYIFRGFPEYKGLITTCLNKKMCTY